MTKQDAGLTPDADEASTVSAESERSKLWEEIADAHSASGDEGDSDPSFRTADDEDDPYRVDDDRTSDDEDDTSDDDEDDPDGDEDTDEAGSGDDGEADQPDQEEDDQDREAKKAALLQKYKSARGRAQSHAKTASKLLEELSKYDKEAATELTDNQDDDLTAQMDDVVDEYGDIMKPVVATVKKLQAQLADLDKSDSRREDAQNRLNDISERAYADLIVEHPDGFAVIDENEEAYAKWVNDWVYAPETPAMYRDIIAQNRKTLVDGNGAALLISAFKDHLAGSTSNSNGKGSGKTETKLDKRRQRQKDGARTTRTGGRQAASSEPPPESTDRSMWFDRYAKDGLLD